MLETVLGLIHNALTLVFGVFLSAAFLGHCKNRKDIISLSCFTVLIGVLFGGCFLLFGYGVTEKLYPVIIHIPLILFYKLFFKIKLTLSILATLLAYLCCQISNWVGIAAVYASHRLWVCYAVRIAVTVAVFVIFRLYVTSSLEKLIRKPTTAVVILSIIPIVYYFFDYFACVYTGLLYSGLDVVVEFLGFVLCISFVLFIVFYFKQYEQKCEMEQKNRLMLIQQIQTKRQMEAIRRSEKKISILRHDMRHFLSTVAVFVENGDNAAALEHISGITAAIEQTVTKKYSKNEIIDIIVASREQDMINADIEFYHNITVPEKLVYNDVELSSILSNALENAIQAACGAEDKKIYLDISMHNKKMLISIKNTYGERPRFENGVPVTSEQGHGFGTQSIINITEKLGGNYHFSLEDDMFILKIII